MTDERSNHLWLEQLADYAEGRLDPAGVERVQKHLSECLDCQEEWRWLSATIAVLAAEPWQAPSEDARTAVSRAFKEAHQPLAVQPPVAKQHAGADAGLWQQVWRA